MKTIYKYEVKAGLNELYLPQDTKVLTVQIQDDNPYMWAIVKTDKPLVKRLFYTYGTGHEIKHLIKEYIGTFQLLNLGLVFHLFEVEPE